MALILFLVFRLLLQGALEMPARVYMVKGGSLAYQCKTSGVVVHVMHEWIETDDCIRACWVDRSSIGILLQPRFTTHLCSSECCNYRPNVVISTSTWLLQKARATCMLLTSNRPTILTNGAYLPSMCAAHRANPHYRATLEIPSLGHASDPRLQQHQAIAAAPLAEAPLSAEPYYRY